MYIYIFSIKYKYNNLYVIINSGLFAPNLSACQNLRHKTLHLKVSSRTHRTVHSHWPHIANSWSANSFIFLELQNIFAHTVRERERVKRAQTIRATFFPLSYLTCGRCCERKLRTVRICPYTFAHSTRATFTPRPPQQKVLFVRTKLTVPAATPRGNNRNHFICAKVHYFCCK